MASFVVFVNIRSNALHDYKQRWIMWLVFNNLSFNFRSNGNPGRDSWRYKDPFKTMLFIWCFGKTAKNWERAKFLQWAIMFGIVYSFLKVFVVQT